jgi:hypothetical protein
VLIPKNATGSDVGMVQRFSGIESRLYPEGIILVHISKTRVITVLNVSGITIVEHGRIIVEHVRGFEMFFGTLKPVLQQK